MARAATQKPWLAMEFLLFAVYVKGRVLSFSMLVPWRLEGGKRVYLLISASVFVL